MLGRNEAIKITEEEDKEILKALNFYNDLGGCTSSHRPAFGKPYTEVCVVDEKLDDGIIRLALLYRGNIFAEKEFRKQPCVETSESFINRIKAFLYEGIESVFVPYSYHKIYET